MVSVPQQGLLIMNYADKITTYGYWAKFPSPTGVSYYESDYIFRTTMRIIKTGFRPQQGLLIMNKQVIYDESRSEGFRPQQGLLIMNFYPLPTLSRLWFPSPTGVTYYELTV